MLRHRIALLLVTILVACGGSPPSADDSGPADAGPADSTPPDAYVAPPDAAIATTIAFTQPAASVEFARGTVRLQLVTTGPDADRVELWKDGSLLVALPPPYTYDWLSEVETEGDHTFQARALIGGAVVAMADRAFVIDRTAPTFVEARPATGTAGRLLEPMEIEMSEALDATTAMAAVTLELAGAPVDAAVSLSSDGTTIEILTSGLTVPVDVRIRVGTGLTDRAGNALATAITHDVHFAAWAPLWPSGLWPSGRNINDIVVDAADDVWILSTEGSLPGPLLWRWDGTMLHSEAMPAAAPAVGARLTTTRAGDPVVAYLTDAYDVHVARHSSGGWTEDPVLSGSDVPHEQFSFEVELSSDDSPVVVRVSTDTFHVARLGSGAWVPVDAPFTISRVYGYSFALDEDLPIFSVVSFQDCVLVSGGVPYTAVTGFTDCSGTLTLERPGPGADAFLRTSASGPGGTTTSGTERWRHEAGGWYYAGSLTSLVFAGEETNDGYYFIAGTSVMDELRRTWTFDAPDTLTAVAELHDAPIAAAYSQLYVPLGAPIAP